MGIADVIAAANLKFDAVGKDDVVVPMDQTKIVKQFSQEDQVDQEQCDQDGDCPDEDGVASEPRHEELQNHRENDRRPHVPGAIRETSFYAGTTDPIITLQRQQVKEKLGMAARQTDLLDDITRVTRNIGDKRKHLEKSFEKYDKIRRTFSASQAPLYRAESQYSKSYKYLSEACGRLCKNSAGESCSNKCRAAQTMYEKRKPLSECPFGVTTHQIDLEVPAASGGLCVVM